MVRRTKEEALATRAALLDAAEKVFRQHGVTRATLGAVASAAGVTRGALYWHFRDKDELFAALCQRATLPMQSRLEQAAARAGDDALATLREVAVQGLREIAANPRTRAVLESFSANRNSRRPAPMRRKPRPWTANARKRPAASLPAPSHKVVCHPIPTAHSPLMHCRLIFAASPNSG